MMTRPPKISYGFEESERQAVAALYWQGFQNKLHNVLGPPNRALCFLQKSLRPEFVLVARDEAHRIIGIAGFHTKEGCFSGGSLQHMRSIYGLWGTTWRRAVMSVLDRKIADQVLHIDGFVVAPTHRGHGIGRLLIDALVQVAQDLECEALSLDVSDDNDRARALYERTGFRVITQHRLGVFRWVFGFRASTHMQLCLRDIKVLRDHKEQMQKTDRRRAQNNPI